MCFARGVSLAARIISFGFDSDEVICTRCLCPSRYAHHRPLRVLYILAYFVLAGQFAIP